LLESVGARYAWIEIGMKRSLVCRAAGRVPVIETENPSLRYFRSDYGRSAPRSAYRRLLVLWDSSAARARETVAHVTL
jgi:hypothetical protein